MFWFYMAAAIFGGAFVVPMALGGLASDLDADVGGDVGGDVGAAADFDVEAEFDAEFEVEAGDAELEPSGAVDGAVGAVVSSLASFRTVVFFLAFFGVAGLVFGWLGYGSVATLLSALLVGGIAAAMNATLFGLLRHSQANSQISDRTLEGRWAQVVLPMNPDQRGRIRIDLSGQPQYLVAKPLDDGSTQQFDVGTSVVVVKIENGTALVSSVPELDAGEES